MWNLCMLGGHSLCDEGGTAERKTTFLPCMRTITVPKAMATFFLFPKVADWFLFCDLLHSVEKCQNGSLNQT